VKGIVFIYEKTGNFIFDYFRLCAGFRAERFAEALRHGKSL
jgi:hypothetical protein